jgi:hypothetical protein
MNWWHYNDEIEEQLYNCKIKEINLEEKITAVPISSVPLKNSNGPKTCDGKNKIIPQKNGKNENTSVHILINPNSSDDEPVIFLKEKLREWNKILLYPQTVSILVQTLEVCLIFNNSGILKI